MDPAAGWFFQEVCRCPSMKNKLWLRMWVFYLIIFQTLLFVLDNFFLACFCYLMAVCKTCGGTASCTAQDLGAETAQKKCHKPCCLLCDCNPLALRHSTWSCKKQKCLLTFSQGNISLEITKYILILARTVPAVSTSLSSCCCFLKKSIFMELLCLESLH